MYDLAASSEASRARSAETANPAVFDLVLTIRSGKRPDNRAPDVCAHDQSLCLATDTQLSSNFGQDERGRRAKAGHWGEFKTDLRMNCSNFAGPSKSMSNPHKKSLSTNSPAHSIFHLRFNQSTNRAPR